MHEKVGVHARAKEERKESMIDSYEDFVLRIRQRMHVNEITRELARDDLDRLKEERPEEYKRYWRKLQKELRERHKNR